MDRNFKLVAFGLLAFLLLLLLYISFMDKREEERGHLSSVAEESLKGGKVPRGRKEKTKKKPFLWKGTPPPKKKAFPP
jgi:hypothetical protein